jgi:pimeloyl-ACP methyl ester carboxylesterase
MPAFDSDGVRIAYELHGPDDGIPTVLVHGFASDFRLNWQGTRWIETLTAAGRLVVGPDMRGHGGSDKPHDPAAYDEERLARDVVGLLDHLGVGEADLVGYSMGARVGLRLAATTPERLGRAVLGGIGTQGGIAKAGVIAARLRGEMGPGDPVADTFYQFASARAVNDLRALAACITGLANSSAVDPARVAVPVLLVNGDRDDLARGGAELAGRMPGASWLELPGRDHLSAVPDRRFKAAALDFLDSAQSSP